MDIFEEISEKYEYKLIKSVCRALAKKCSYKSSKDMSALTELIDLMYLYRDHKMAVTLYNIIENVEFSGNYTVWDEILYAKWTIVRIYRETNQAEKYEKQLKSVMEYENAALYENRKRNLRAYGENYVSLSGRTTLSAGWGDFLGVRWGGALPRPRATARVAPTECNKRCSTGGRGRTPPLRRGYK